MKSAYDVLGISPSASEEDVRRAFRNYSKILHPDVCKRATAAVEFKELKKAYDTLIDRTERQRHDYALAVVETKDVEKDAIDSVLDSYGIDVPKKKKKKKKVKKKEDIAQAHAYSPPPYVPPAVPASHYHRRGDGQFEGIPDGFEDIDNLGGVL